MTYKLGKNVEVGQKIKTANGWRKIKAISDDGAMVSDEFVKFGNVVYGWKIK